MEQADILQFVAPDLQKMEVLLKEELASDHPFLMQLHEQVKNNSGKRLRPLLLFLSARAVGYEGSLAVLYAAVYELIHTATLIHDDVIDLSDQRRGQPSLNSLHDNTISVLYGDLLYAKANMLATKAGRLDVLHVIHEVTQRMVEGEILQNKFNYSVDIDEASYFDILTRKTAYLFAGTTQTAGMLVDSAHLATQLNAFGFNLGVAFQLVDDYLDYTGQSETLGKPALHDLATGKLTLPAIRFVRDNPRAKDEIQALWQAPGATVPESLAEQIRRGPYLDGLKVLAESYADKALTALDGLPDSPLSRLLFEMPRFILDRRK